jgi:crotonobetainyl-CoA:carnitine CoA-transferase CaiB-like acyl-CoA transferase
VVNQALLDPILDAAFGAEDRAVWLERLGAANVPAGAINTVPEVFADPQVVHRGMLRHIPHPLAGTVPQVMNPLRFSAAPSCAELPPPLLGEHTAQVLGELGYSAADIAQLAERAVT